MEAAHLAVRIAELLIFGWLALVSIQRFRLQRDRAALWWAATVANLAFVVLASFVIPAGSDSELASWERKVLVAVLLLFPYTLFRYGGEFVKPKVYLRRMAEAMTAVVVVWTFLLPKLEGEGAERTTTLLVFTIAVLVQWTVLSSIMTTRLWRVGRNQASLARKRMRLMAVGSGLLNFALVFSAFLPNEPDSAWPIVTGVMAIVCALCFFAGFMPPKFLRVIWRSPDVDKLRHAELSLMSVVDPAQIGNALLPHVTALFGGDGAVLVGKDGRVLATWGLTTVEASAAAVLATRANGQPVIEQGILGVKLRQGWLAVRGNALSPFFGREEVDLLAALGLFTDLALDRAELFELERVARLEAQKANAELETFVYSVSHDLKSPLVSLLGFLDYLKADVEASVSDEGRFFLERISASSMYMQALIQDLLELSRIGRVQTETSEVDLGVVVREVVAELEGVDQGATFDIGPLPVVEVNSLRARQLFTNLLSNAVSHSGRDDVTVSVEAVADSSGAVLLSVADNGRGIPATYWEKIFGVFEQLERQDTGGGGTGIGLAVCRKIVEQMGGDISVSDNAPGARFSIRLPAAAVRRGPARLEAAT